MVQKWIADLPEKTGRSLEDWIKATRASGLSGLPERVDWLKKEHGLGTNAARLIAERAEGKGSEQDDPEAYLRTAELYVEAMFAGPKAGLRPVYHRLLEVGLGLGDDVKACPCKTIVPLYRNHVFAEIKSTTLTRVDLGFALGKASPSLPAGRRVETGGQAKGNRITHRIPIKSVAEIDDEVKHWLRVAYDLDA
jgi:hypothetical protein